MSMIRPHDDMHVRTPERPSAVPALQYSGTVRTPRIGTGGYWEDDIATAEDYALYAAQAMNAATASDAEFIADGATVTAYVHGSAHFSATFRLDEARLYPYPEVYEEAKAELVVELARSLLEQREGWDRLTADEREQAVTVLLSDFAEFGTGTLAEYADTEWWHTFLADVLEVYIPDLDSWRAYCESGRISDTCPGCARCQGAGGAS